MSILTEAYKIYYKFIRSLQNEFVFNSNGNVSISYTKINFSIEGINFTFIKNDCDCCYLDKDTETIYLEKSTKDNLYCQMWKFETEINRKAIFIAILRILILRTDKIRFSNEIELTKYLNAALFINFIYANDLQDLLKKDFYDKEIICSWLTNFKFNAIGNQLFIYIKGLTSNEYQEFTNIIDQEITLCRIKNTNLRALSIL